MNEEKADSLKTGSSKKITTKQLVFRIFVILLSLLIFIILMLSFKESHDAKQKRSYAENYLPSSEMSYFKDERTGLCFAYFVDQRIGVDYISITNVPCEKVEKLLISTPSSLKTPDSSSSGPVSE